MLSFVSSTLWIAGFSYIMVWMVRQVFFFVNIMHVLTLRNMVMLANMLVMQVHQCVCLLKTSSKGTYCNSTYCSPPISFHLFFPSILFTSHFTSGLQLCTFINDIYTS